jgi:hypothetical protein
MPADADTLPLLPVSNPFTQFVDDARYFVSWDAGILNAWPQTFYCEYITVADTTGEDLNAHLPCTRLGDLALDDLEIGFGLGNLRNLHGCRCD